MEAGEPGSKHTHTHSQIERKDSGTRASERERETTSREAVFAVAAAAAAAAAKKYMHILRLQSYIMSETSYDTKRFIRHARGSRCILSTSTCIHILLFVHFGVLRSVYHTAAAAKWHTHGTGWRPGVRTVPHK